MTFWLIKSNPFKVTVMRVSMKRRIFSAVGVILAVFGLIWLLQGAGILSGSVMTGSEFWEVVGAITFIIGLVIVPFSLKK